MIRRLLVTMAKSNNASDISLYRMDSSTSLVHTSREHQYQSTIYAILSYSYETQPTAVEQLMIFDPWNLFGHTPLLPNS